QAAPPHSPAGSTVGTPEPPPRPPASVLPPAGSGPTAEGRGPTAEGSAPRAGGSAPPIPRPVGLAGPPAARPRPPSAGPQAEPAALGPAGSRARLPLGPEALERAAWHAGLVPAASQPSAASPRTCLDTGNPESAAPSTGWLPHQRRCSGTGRPLPAGSRARG